MTLNQLVDLFVLFIFLTFPLMMLYCSFLGLKKEKYSKEEIETKRKFYVITDESKKLH